MLFVQENSLFLQEMDPEIRRLYFPETIPDSSNTMPKTRPRSASAVSPSSARMKKQDKTRPRSAAVRKGELEQGPVPHTRDIDEITILLGLCHNIMMLRVRMFPQKCEAFNSCCHCLLTKSFPCFAGSLETQLWRIAHERTPGAVRPKSKKKKKKKKKSPKKKLQRLSAHASLALNPVLLSAPNRSTIARQSRRWSSYRAHSGGWACDSTSTILANRSRPCMPVAARVFEHTRLATA